MGAGRPIRRWAGTRSILEIGCLEGLHVPDGSRDVLDRQMLEDERQVRALLLEEAQVAALREDALAELRRIDFRPLRADILQVRDHQVIFEARQKGIRQARPLGQQVFAEVIVGVAHHARGAGWGSASGSAPPGHGS